MKENGDSTMSLVHILSVFNVFLSDRILPLLAEGKSLLTQHIAGNRCKLAFFTSKHTSFQHAKITKFYEPWQDNA